MENAPSLRDRLAALADFLPIFTAPGFRFAEFVEPVMQEDGSLVLGWWNGSEQALRLHEVVYKFGWITPDFDWSHWANSREAQDLMSDPAALTRATAPARNAAYDNVPCGSIHRRRAGARFRERLADADT